MTKTELYLQDRNIPYRKDFPLGTKSTVKIGGTAEYAVFVRTEKQLICLLLFAKAENIPLRIFGGLSNTLVLDGFHPGFTVFTDRLNCVKKHGEFVTLGAGAKPSAVATKFAKDGIGVLYKLFGIPGTVGGGIFGNAGAYGATFGEECVGGTVYDTKKGEILTLPAEELGFSYRHSRLQTEPWILLDATFRSHELPKEEIRREIGFLKVRRASTQPIDKPSLGSVFKRNGEPAAPAYYIDALGLRGFRIGGAQVSEKHAGFIVNRGGATAKDYLELLDSVRNQVKSAYNIQLVPEIGIY